MTRKTVVLEKMELSDNNPAGRLRMTEKILETKSFDEQNANQILNDGALSKQWRRKAMQPKEFAPTVVKTIVDAEVKEKSEGKVIEILSKIRSTDDIGYLQSLLTDPRETIVNAAKQRLNKLS